MVERNYGGGVEEIVNSILKFDMFSSIGYTSNNQWWAGPSKGTFIYCG